MFISNAENGVRVRTTEVTAVDTFIIHLNQSSLLICARKLR